MPKFNWKYALVIFLILLFALIFGEYYFSLRSLPQTISHWGVSNRWLESVAISNKERINRFYNHTLADNLTPSKWKDPPSIWNKKGGLKEMLETYQNASKSESARLKIQEKCKKYSTQIELMQDHECRAEWRRELKEEEIVGVEEMLGFKGAQKLAALKVLFRSGKFGWYKACGYHHEMPENEVIASILDEVFSQHRVAPVVMRNVSIALLNNLILEQGGFLDHRRIILSQQAEVCGIDGEFVGAMIGWWENVVPTETIPKMASSSFNSKQMTSYRKTLNSTWQSQISANHAFFYVIGTLRPLGYNEYLISNYPKEREGTLIALDLDRLSFLEESTFPTEAVTVCNLCKFSRSTYDTYNELKALPTYQFSLLLQHGLAFDIPPIKIDLNSIKQIHLRIQALTKCFDECIFRYGMDNVVLR